MNTTRTAVTCVLLSLLASASAHAATPLFPKAFHVVREINDSLTGHVTRVDEYYAGDQVITINGDKTAIADYAKQELTEIDRGKATYGTATFAQLAAALPAQTVKPAATKPVIERRGQDRRAGRNVDVMTADDTSNALHAEIAVDHSIVLSKDAFEVVAGAAFPRNGGPAADLLRGAAQNPRSRTSSESTTSGDTFAMPIEQTLRWSLHGQSVEATTRVITIDDQQPSPQLIVIPAGARRVEAKAIEAKRIAADADALVPTRTEH